MAIKRLRRAAFLICSTSVIAGCVQDGNFDFLKPKAEGDVVSSDAASLGSVKMVERDVEAPEVFEANDQGLWDGRPSLGGVWVAHASAEDPERVIIRNEENGKYVIGALFKRERENPGPAIQVSSDAASALGMLAGAPDTLSVIALLRQEVPIAEDTGAPAAQPGSETLPAAENIQTASLDDPIDAAGAALTNVQPVSAPATLEPSAKKSSVTASAAAALAAPAPRAAPTKLAKPYVQIGLFSVQQNAKNAGVSLRNAGIVPSVLTETSKGKTYYRVTAGPAPTSADRAALLKKVKGLGYNDAYFVRK